MAHGPLWRFEPTRAPLEYFSLEQILLRDARAVEHSLGGPPFGAFEPVISMGRLELGLLHFGADRAMVPGE